MHHKRVMAISSREHGCNTWSHCRVTDAYHLTFHASGVRQRAQKIKGGWYPELGSNWADMSHRRMKGFCKSKPNACLGHTSSNFVSSCFDIDP
jgi:hypothetical protein